MNIQYTQDRLDSMGAKKGSGRGGFRPGAGRPRIVQEPERIAVDLEKSELDALREIASRRETSVADLIRRAVSQFLKRAQRR